MAARKDMPELSPVELRERRLRSKNLAICAVLAGLVVLFYFLTIVRFGGTL